MKKTIVI